MRGVISCDSGRVVRGENLRFLCLCVGLLFRRGWSEVLIKYTGKYVKIYFIIKITYQYTYLNTYLLAPACPTFYVLYGMTIKVGLPVKGVSNGSAGS